MNPDDEPLLSAYVDGELPEEQRSTVESAVRSLPDWAERCRDLRRVGEIVGALSRPSASRDQSPEILAELRRRRSVFHWIGWFDRPLISKSMVLFGAAASLVACAAIGLAVATRVKNGPGVEFTLLGGARPQPAVLATGDEPGSRPKAVGDVGPSSMLPSTPLVAAAGTSQTSLAGRRAPLNPEVEQTRRLLESPTLKDRFFVTDVIGGDAEGWIGRHFKQTPRRNDAFARILLEPENKIDPGHPGEAVVFVVVLNPLELDALRGDLQRRFHERLVVSTIDPSISERLARVDRSFIEQGTQVANVVVPRGTTSASLAAAPPRDEPKIAIVGPGRATDVADESETSVERDVDRKTPEQESIAVPPAAPEAAKASPPGASDPRASVPPARSDSSVVLVWVTTRGRQALPPLTK